MSEKKNDNEPKRRLSELVSPAEASEEIMPLRAEGVKRKAGRMRGCIRIGDDFEAPFPGSSGSDATSSRRSRSPAGFDPLVG